MNSLFLSLFILCTNFLIGQSILQPSENIKLAFDKKYPIKKPIWSMEYGNDENDINFIAKFLSESKSQVYAVYDSDGNFKAYKELITSAKLPKEIQSYLDANYPIKIYPKPKAKSKTKAKPTSIPTRQAFFVVDDNNKETYEVKAEKDKKKYRLIFGKDGNLVKRIQIG